MAISRRQIKDGSYVYQVKVRDPNGNWYPTPTYPSLTDAENEEVRLKQLNRKGKLTFSEDAKVVTVSEFWEVWSDQNRGKVSAGWKITQDQMWRDYAEPVIGKYRMREVDKPLIGHIFKRMEDLGRSAQTRKHVYTLLRTMFGDAVDYYEMLAVNPVNPKWHRPKVNEKKRAFLVPENAWRLLEYTRNHYLGPAIWLQTLAAMRVEAVMGLAWESVQWDRDQILICRAWKQKVGLMEDHPKGKDWEYVPMIPALKAYLWPKWKASLDPNAFVCKGAKGGMLPYETYLHALRRICPQAGVPNVTTHELRHSATEIWVRAGASQEDIRRLLHHKNDSATKRYMHRTETRLTQIGQGIQPSLEKQDASSQTEMFHEMFQLGNKEAECLEEGLTHVH